MTTTSDLRPDTIDQLASDLASAHAEEQVVRPVGGGTHQSIGYPIDPDVEIGLSGLDAVVDYQPEDLTMTIGAGMTVAEAEQLANRDGRTTVLLEHPGSGTVGGAVATGLSGWRRLRYGPTRDRILEVTMVSGDGRVVTSGGRVVKNVTGYDIPKLATGSLGRFGIIAQVCLKLWPLPEHAATIQVEDPRRALALAYRPMAVIEGEHDSRVVLAGTAAEVEAQASLLGEVVADEARYPVPLTAVDGVPVWSLRVPPALLPEARAVIGRVPYQIAWGVGEILLRSEERIDVMRAWAESVGGAMTLRDGKTELDPWGKPPPTLRLQRRLLNHLDPSGIINRGRLPGRL